MINFLRAPVTNQTQKLTRITPIKVAIITVSCRVATIALNRPFSMLKLRCAGRTGPLMFIPFADSAEHSFANVAGEMPCTGFEYVLVGAILVRTESA